VAAAELAAAGVAVDVVLLEDPGRADVLVESVDAPTRVRKGESYDVTVQLRNTAAEPAGATLRLLADGRPVHREQVTVDPGASAIVVRQKAGRSGTVRYEAVLESGSSSSPGRDV
jgi:hypothetical protein